MGLVGGLIGGAVAGAMNGQGVQQGAANGVSQAMAAAPQQGAPPQQPQGWVNKLKGPAMAAIRSKFGKPPLPGSQPPMQQPSTPPDQGGPGDGF